ncbi:MAG TPA: N-acetyltransferase [Candidatus Limnocylindrales bacterium]|nr:N-acetyltransferase [Candidatus Limnocylindrales bacterium]
MRRAEPADREAVFAVESAAFGRPDEALIVERIVSSPRAINGLSLVVDDGGAIVGHILFSHVDLVRDDTTSEVLALGPMAVHPDHQRRGVGGQLIHAGLAVAEERRERLVVVLGHADYYPRFGFLPAADVGVEPPDGMSIDHYFALPLTAYDPLFRGQVRYGPEWGVE